VTKHGKEAVAYARVSVRERGGRTPRPRRVACGECGHTPVRHQRTGNIGYAIVTAFAVEAYMLSSAVAAGSATWLSSARVRDDRIPRRNPRKPSPGRGKTAGPVHGVRALGRGVGSCA
jgi:hypothetical protein